MLGSKHDTFLITEIHQWDECGIVFCELAAFEENVKEIRYDRRGTYLAIVRKSNKYKKRTEEQPRTIFLSVEFAETRNHNYCNPEL